MQKYEHSVLMAALADIDNLAAPRNIDAVCAVLSVGVASFVRKGSVQMRAEIEAAIANANASRVIKKSARARKQTPVA